MDGAVLHRDSAGFTASVRPGDIALMTAGRGITHEELPDPNEPRLSSRVYFAQLWLALPDDKEETEPGFEHYRRDELPLARLDGGTARVVMGSAWRLQAPTTCHAPTVFADLQLRAGAEESLDVDAEELAVMVIEGDAALDGAALDLHALHVIKANGSQRKSVLSAVEDCRVLLLGGDVFTSRRWIGGSFVASSESKIARWSHDASFGLWPRIP